MAETTRVADHLPEKLFLVGEVEVDGALGEPGALGDVLQARSREAALAKHSERRGQDLPRPLPREPPPARLNRSRIFSSTRHL